MREIKDMNETLIREMELQIKQTMLETIRLMNSQGVLEHSDAVFFNDKLCDALDEECTRLCQTNSLSRLMYFEALKRVYKDKTPVVEVYDMEGEKHKLRYKDLTTLYYKSGNCSRLFAQFTEGINRDNYNSYIKFLNSSDKIDELDYSRSKNYISDSIEFFNRIVPKSLQKHCAGRWIIDPNKDKDEEQIEPYNERDFKYSRTNFVRINELQSNFEKRSKNLTIEKHPVEPTNIYMDRDNIL